MIGVKITATASSAFSSTGISMNSARARSGVRAANSSETLAPSEVPPITACSTPRWSSSAATWSANELIE